MDTAPTQSRPPQRPQGPTRNELLLRFAEGAFLFGLPAGLLMAPLGVASAVFGALLFGGFGGTLGISE